MNHKLPDLLQRQYDRYMSRADDAETCARVCADPQERASWERVAEGWRELAAKLLRGSRL